MAIETELLLLPNQPIASLEEYKRLGGGEGWRVAARESPQEVVDSLKQARLRGRGGAGFPTAMKWQGALDADGGRRFVVANGAEGEPGTFKDRLLMRMNPYAVVEGLIIAEEVLGTEHAYLGIKERFEPEIESVERAIDEFSALTPLASEIEIVPGPDEYLFGEETGLLEVIEGGLPMPHVFPPYVHGLFSGAYGGPGLNPTVIDNVETLAHVPGIVANGPEWFRALGSPDTPGTTIFTVSGDVTAPAVKELPLGMTIEEVIRAVAGGVRPGHKVKAVFSGLANAVITPDKLRTPLAFDAMRQAGVSLGSAGLIVYGETRCMVAVAYEFSHFLHVESCGQCPSCKLGSATITSALEKLLLGIGGPEDLAEASRGTGWVENNHRCYLPTSEALVIGSILDAYQEDFRRHLFGVHCGLDHDIVLPKMVDYAPEKGFTYDLDYVRKRPDWSYAHG